MNFHVISQLRLQTESLSAILLGALVSVLANVKSLVFVKIAVLSEGFVAKFALVRLFTGVRSNVALEMIRRIKSHFTKLALKMKKKCEKML